MFERYHLHGFPTLVILDREGKVRDFRVGYQPDVARRCVEERWETRGGNKGFRPVIVRHCSVPARNTRKQRGHEDEPLSSMRREFLLTARPQKMALRRHGLRGQPLNPANRDPSCGPHWAVDDAGYRPTH